MGKLYIAARSECLLLTPHLQTTSNSQEEPSQDLSLRSHYSHISQNS